jgi:hypothetical protein
MANIVHTLSSIFLLWLPWIIPILVGQILIRFLKWKSVIDIARLHYPSMKDAMLEFIIDLQDTLIHGVNWYKEHVESN